MFMIWHGMGFNLEACMEKALEMNLLSFAFGTGRYMAGGCYSEAIHVDEDFWNLNLERNAGAGIVSELAPKASRFSGMCTV